MIPGDSFVKLRNFRILKSNTRLPHLSLDPFLVQMLLLVKPLHALLQVNHLVFQPYSLFMQQVSRLPMFFGRPLPGSLRGKLGRQHLRLGLRATERKTGQKNTCQATTLPIMGHLLRWVPFIEQTLFTLLVEFYHFISLCATRHAADSRSGLFPPGSDKRYVGISASKGRLFKDEMYGLGPMWTFKQLPASLIESHRILKADDSLQSNDPFYKKKSNSIVAI